LVYDNEYRHPNDPPGPTPVDCTRTGRIGVTFLLTRRFNLSEEAIRLEVRWIHSGLQEGKSIVENGTSVFWRGVDGVIDSWGIPLTDERKIEGVVTVRIKANGTEVLENSFKLVGCPKAAAQVINYWQAATNPMITSVMVLRKTMQRNWKSILAAFVASCVVTLLGVKFFFGPIAQSDAPTGPILSPVVGFFIYVVLSIALFDWVARQLRNAYKAAFIVAASQFILVNVDFVFRGERGLITAAASTVLLAATWLCVAFAYSIFTREKNS
jgi:hypothetical protein